MREQAQLIAYADRFGGSLLGLRDLLDTQLGGVFGGVHILPFYERIDGADAGFDPEDHQRIDSRLGTWSDLQAVAGTTTVMADLIANHISSASPQFADYRKRGADSPYASMFLTFDAVFPDGATEEELAAIYRPRPGLPFTPMTLGDGGRRIFWTTFTRDQIDLNLADATARDYLRDTLFLLAQHGVRMVRLDAVGYVIKKAGTSCFLIPETLSGLTRVTDLAQEVGVTTLAEVHAHHSYQWRLAECVDYIYDFALAPVVLHAVLTADVDPLLEWLDVRPRNAVTVLDTHDGIGIVDAAADPSGLKGLLTDEQIEALFAHVYAVDGHGARRANESSVAELSRYRLNSTWYSAVGEDDAKHLISRLIHLWVPGLPQLYYVGLLAGSNDAALLGQTGEARDINRHRYTRSEINAALRRRVVRATLGAVQLRNTHPAFGGEFSFSGGDGLLTMAWRAADAEAVLTVDLANDRFRVSWAHGRAQHMADSARDLAHLMR